MFLQYTSETPEDETRWIAFVSNSNYREDGESVPPAWPWDPRTPGSKPVLERLEVHAGRHAEIFLELSLHADFGMSSNWILLPESD